MATITSPVLQNSKRPEDPKFPVWDLDGNKHMLTQPNVNDKVRHCGWYQKDPAQLMAQALAMRSRAEALIAASQHAAGSGQAAPTAAPAAAGEEAGIPRLTLMRKELSDAGGIPDPTWGVAKLEQAIAAKKAGVTMPKDADDDE